MNSPDDRASRARRSCRRAGGALSASCLGALLLAMPASAQEPQEPADSFVDRITVTAVELMIDVRDDEGRPVLGLEPTDFEVLEDGEPMKVLGLDYPPRPAATLPAVSPLDPRAVDPFDTPAVERDRWRFLIYFDMPLTRRRTLRRGIEALLDQAGELVVLGPVEVVVANPEPRVVLPFTRDGEELRRALAEVRREPNDPEVVRIRRGYLTQMDWRFHAAEPGPGEMEQVFNLIRSSVRREFLFLDRRVRTLARWIAGYGHAPASAAILVSDGYDMTPVDFYIRSSAMQAVDLQLRQELVHYRLDSLTESLAREIAAHGWTSLSLAMGAAGSDAVDASMAYRDRFRSIGESSDFGYDPGAQAPTSILERPTEALLLVASQTGGEVMTARDTASGALRRIGERLRLTYQAERPSDGRVHAVEVRLRGEGLVLRAPRAVRSPTPEQVAESRSQRLLVSARDTGDLPVSVTQTDLRKRGPEGGLQSEVEILFDLNLLRPVLPEARVPLAFTFAVELPGEPPLVRHVIQPVALPAGGSAADWPRFSYKVVLEVPRNARRLAVVVEERASGVWGGAVAGPAG